MSKTARTMVDSGTHDGIHVPVGSLCSILSDSQVLDGYVPMQAIELHRQLQSRSEFSHTYNFAYNSWQLEFSMDFTSGTGVNHNPKQGAKAD